jgi:hypothetical protein
VLISFYNIPLLVYVVVGVFPFRITFNSKKDHGVCCYGSEVRTYARTCARRDVIFFLIFGGLKHFRFIFLDFWTTVQITFTECFSSQLHFSKCTNVRSFVSFFQGYFIGAGREEPVDRIRGERVWCVCVRVC